MAWAHVAPAGRKGLFQAHAHQGMNGGRTSDVHPLEHVLGRRRQRTEFERLADQFAPLFRAQKGFKSVTFFEADAAAGEYGSFSLWDTREDAEAADAALRPQLRQAVSGLGLQMQGTPIRRIGEAYEPKA